MDASMQLAKGTLIMAHGLASAEFNGCFGRVLGFDAGKCRYMVQLDKQKTGILLRPCNVCPQRLATNVAIIEDLKIANFQIRYHRIGYPVGCPGPSETCPQKRICGAKVLQALISRRDDVLQLAETSISSSNVEHMLPEGLLFEFESDDYDYHDDPSNFNESSIHWNHQTHVLNAVAAVRTLVKAGCRLQGVIKNLMTRSLCNEISFWPFLALCETSISVSREPEIKEGLTSEHVRTFLNAQSTWRNGYLPGFLHSLAQLGLDIPLDLQADCSRLALAHELRDDLAWSEAKQESGHYSGSFSLQKVHQALKDNPAQILDYASADRRVMKPMGLPCHLPERFFILPESCHPAITQNDIAKETFCLLVEHGCPLRKVLHEVAFHAREEGRDNGYGASLNSGFLVDWKMLEVFCDAVVSCGRQRELFEDADAHDVHDIISKRYGYFERGEDVHRYERQEVTSVAKFILGSGYSIADLIEHSASFQSIVSRVFPLADAVGRGEEVVRGLNELMDAKDLESLFDSGQEALPRLMQCGLTLGSRFESLEKECMKKLGDCMRWVSTLPESVRAEDHIIFNIKTHKAVLSKLQAWRKHELSRAEVMVRMFVQVLPRRAAYDIAGYWLTEPRHDHQVKPPRAEKSTPSTWHETIEFIEHEEPAAVVDPEVARSASELEWVDAVASRIAHDKDSLPPTIQGMDIEEKLFLLSFRRNPRELREKLLEGPELQSCRDELRNNGLAYTLPSGGMIFVNASQHRAAMEIISSRCIKSHEVVISESLEYDVEAALMSIPSRFRPSREQSNLGPLPSPWAFVEDRTFLAFIPRQRAASSVIQSTGEAHGVSNPRRKVGLMHLD